MGPSTIHRRRTKGKVDLKKIISLKHPNFLLAPGVAKGEVAGDVARFTRLTPTLKSITRQFGDQLYWVYASLETGVHIAIRGMADTRRDTTPGSGRGTWRPKKQKG